MTNNIYKVRSITEKGELGVVWGGGGGEESLCNQCRVKKEVPYDCDDFKKYIKLITIWAPFHKARVAINHKFS